MKLLNCIFLILLSVNTFADDIWESAKNNDLDAVKRYVEKIGVNVNTRDADGKTPLHYAVENDSIEVVNYLISKSADINAKSLQAESVIYTAINSRSVKSTKLLIDNNVNLLVPIPPNFPKEFYLNNNAITINTLFEFAISKCYESDDQNQIASFRIAKMMYAKLSGKNKLLQKDYDIIDNYLIAGDLEKVKGFIKNGNAPSVLGTKAIFINDEINLFQYMTEVGIFNIEKDYLKYLVNSLDFDAIQIIKYIFSVKQDIKIAFVYDNEQNIVYPGDKKIEIATDYSLTYYTILARAVEKKSYRIVEYFINSDKSLANYRYFYFTNDSWIAMIPLGRALLDKDEVMVKLLVEGGSDLSSKITVTPLMGQSSDHSLLEIWDNPDIISYLKSHGAK